MAKGDRDHRGRLPSTKRCPDSQSGGCSYCVTGDAKRPARRKNRHTAKVEIRRDAQ